MVSKDELIKLGQARGVTVEEVHKGHFHIKGLLLVNYYPFSKNRTAYIDGTVRGVYGVSPEQAIELSLKAPECQGVKDTYRSQKSRRIRKALLKKHPFCHWCNVPLTLDDSTLEHIIPLARGGQDQPKNRTLACFDCNQTRGSNMPELSNVL